MSVKSEYTYPEKIVIGTRGSELAMWQANKVKSLIDNIGQNIDVTIRVIKTSGDWRPEQGEVRLSADEGGKAQFAKEIEEALLEGAVDIAVHSMKDMETDLPDGLVIPYMLPRVDTRDAFLSDIAQNIEDLPMGSVVGTASVRRQAFVLNKRPDLKIVPFRGNVGTRIEKLRAGQVDATFLAVAGLERLGMTHEIASIIESADMLPSVGQGAIGIEMRKGDRGKLSFIGQISCSETYACVECERAVLRALSGSCHTPVGVLATLNEGILGLSVAVVNPDGSQKWVEQVSKEFVDIDDAINLGHEVGGRLKSVVPPHILSDGGQ
ncbi:MAG: hydroxymethylbilane synthase [Alcanivorax sp.]